MSKSTQWTRLLWDQTAPTRGVLSYSCKCLGRVKDIAVYATMCVIENRH